MLGRSVVPGVQQAHPFSATNAQSLLLVPEGQEIVRIAGMAEGFVEEKV